MPSTENASDFSCVAARVSPRTHTSMDTTRAPRSGARPQPPPAALSWIGVDNGPIGWSITARTVTNFVARSQSESKSYLPPTAHAFFSSLTMLPWF